MTQTQPEILKNYSGRDYRSVWQHPRAQFEDFFEGNIIKKLMPTEGGWFLDLGSGYGRTYPLYKKAGRKVVMVDYALNLLQMAEEKYAGEENLYLIAANAYRLPFRDHVFSAGVSIRVFHHMNLPQNFLQECARVFQGGGQMLMEYSNKRNLWRLLKQGKKALQKNHEEYAELQYGTHPEFFQEISQSADFTVTQNQGTGFFPRFISERTRKLSPVLNILENIFDPTLGQAQLAPMHFSRLSKSGKKSARFDDFFALLVCPLCRGELENHPGKMKCIACEKSFAKLGKIIDFRS